MVTDFQSSPGIFVSDSHEKTTSGVRPELLETERLYASTGQRTLHDANFVGGADRKMGETRSWFGETRPAQVFRTHEATGWRQTPNPR